MMKIEIREVPISLESAKLHLRLGDDKYNDVLVRDKLEMAVSIAEDQTGRTIREQLVTMDIVFNTSDDIVRLPVPTTEIKELSYFDNGKKVIVEVDKNLTHYSSFCENILFILNENLVGKKLTIEFICGYTLATIPPSMKAAILLILGTLYDNESNDVIGRITSQLSITAEKILQKYKLSPYV